MKFLTDVGVGKKAENFLKAKDHDVKAVRDINSRLTDFEILQLAIFEKRIIVTMDKDFGELVFNSGYQHNGVLLLRLEDMNGDEKTEIVKFILENFAEKIHDNFCVFHKGRFRFRSK